MSLRRRMPAAAFAALIALSLAGCTPSNPTPTPSPTATRSPLFASDEEALKAATDAYAAYLKVTDEVLASGGAEREAFRQVSTGDAFKKAVSDADEFKRNSAHTVGYTKFDSARLSFYKPALKIPVSIFVCDDVSNVDVVDSHGTSVVSGDRKTRTPWQVWFQASSNSRLVVVDRMLWTGQDYCEG
ncbi:hypothetical protein ACO2Q7_04075 [Rathayibacter sp. KR2-224]|uniref:hypothetical protein n=1 Tax=Rathayibacter sp. KR2-224 TaxID=3400913 RepID=UPI003BFB7514